MPGTASLARPARLRAGIPSAAANASAYIGGQPRPRHISPHCSVGRSIVSSPVNGVSAANGRTWIRISTPRRRGTAQDLCIRAHRTLKKIPRPSTVFKDRHRRTFVRAGAPCTLRYNECITPRALSASNKSWVGARTKAPTRRVANITGWLLCTGDKGSTKDTAGAVGVCLDSFSRRPILPFSPPLFIIFIARVNMSAR